MRAAFTIVLLFITAFAIPCQYADEGDPSGEEGRSSGVGDRRRSEALQEFLTWAHEGEKGCGVPERIEVVQRWPDYIRVRFELPCETRRSFDALLEVHEGEGVWQVRGGCVTSRQILDRALAAAGSISAQAPSPDVKPNPAGHGLPTMVPPPPENPVPQAESSAGGVIRSAEPTRELEPEVPDTAARARPFGPVRVELLVDISPGGVPVRTRMLRGPNPDLGMRQAAKEALLQWRFRPAGVGGTAVRSFAAVEIIFPGLPPESLGWIHRALFRYDAIPSPSRRLLDVALERVQKGESFDDIATRLGVGSKEGEESDFTAAAGLPAAVRRALHEAQVGEPVGPFESDGRFMLIRKTGEVYYAIRSLAGEEASYEILHQRTLGDPKTTKVPIAIPIRRRRGARKSIT